MRSRDLVRLEKYAAVAFAQPALGVLQPVLLVKIVAVILFLAGALNHFVSILPLYAQAEAAARQIDGLERQLAGAPLREPDARQAEAGAMAQIELDDIVFSYEALEGGGFTVGPVKLAIRRGETIFVTGGNGSGKSTFLKLLTGLQRPDVGRIRLNGRPVEDAAIDGYRSLFSAVFWDYHLFDTLYGLDAPEPQALDALLSELALSGKTRLEGRAFATTNLSTGQRKRLAYLVARLEDRQVYIFDEWAADQDPAFRRWFYQIELPRLKSQGKTVIAVTHDEQYFSGADRWLHFVEGRCVELSPASASTSALERMGSG